MTRAKRKVPVPLAGLFVGDALLPEQTRAPFPALSPERRLLLAVLEEAVQNVTLATRLHDRVKDGRLISEARDWFANGNPQDAYSFPGLCEELGWSAEAVLQALRARKLVP